MNTNIQQNQLITTSTGHQYVATYAGVLGDAKYYQCKDVASGNVVGFVATLGSGKFGPLCKDYVVAALRSRNIAYGRDALLAQLFGRRK